MVAEGVLADEVARIEVVQNDAGDRQIVGAHVARGEQGGVQRVRGRCRRR